MQRNANQKGRVSVPARKRAPVSKTTPEKLKLATQHQRLKCTDLERQLNSMQKEIRQSSLEVDHDFAVILDPSSHKVTPFVNLFWQLQNKLFASSPTGVRYYPMLIRFCLSLL